MKRFLMPLALGLALAFPAAAQAQDITVDVGRGPLTVNVPPSYNGSSSMPLVVGLHGYTSSGDTLAAYFKLAALSDSREFFLVAPNGLVDSSGAPYWNATDACCDFESDTDDSTYIRNLIEEIQSQLNVDPKRIYVTGHSNGGFMSYRMACDHADLVAAIAPLAGATWLDTTQCNPSEPVSVLHTHGTADPVIRFDGGCIEGDCYPGAAESVDIWSMYNGCSGRMSFGGTADYDANRRGNETIIRQSPNGCPDGGQVEMLRMNGSLHSPNLTQAWSDAVIDFFYANPKP